ncbi:hypothetical protein GJ744_005516 [Endocarpon pusillum]|uniref:Uncharacterized protein n=1 Tax=Endocarpon pusillum TaxID=364733 RepID=A0A8H7E786_9EURO|nr:hypothetical protein GJ744_005516 [Endocarpon pusillum]
MTFRAKVRKALKGNKSSGDDSSSSAPKRTDIEYYKPGEIPRSKYRGPWDQKHQDHLHAFSFKDALRDRRNSIPASCSPRGTPAQSRRSSWVSRARLSLGSRSGVEDGNAERRKSHASHIGQVAEANEEDADVGNVGLLRRVTTDQMTTKDVNKLELEKTITPSHLRKENTQPFTPAELSKAMTAVAIRPDR